MSRQGAAGAGAAWALVSARAEGISIRTLAAAIGLSPSRVHQLVADADLDALDAALGELRAAGWPAPASGPSAVFNHAPLSCLYEIAPPGIPVGDPQWNGQWR